MQKFVRVEKFKGVKCFNLGGFSLYKEMLNGPNQKTLELPSSNG